MNEEAIKNTQQEDPSKKFPENSGDNGLRNEKSGSLFFELVKVVFWALIIIIPIRTFLFQPFFVQGASMEPNFYNGEYLIVNELGYKQTEIGMGGLAFKVEPFKDLSRGEVVVFRYPKNPSQYFIKRVIGMPGEKVEINKGRIKIFNQQYPEGFFLDEDEYLPSNVITEPQAHDSFDLGQDEYVVFGDNRTQSSDSRTWGKVPQKDIIGRVLLRAWPLDRVELFQ